MDLQAHVLGAAKEYLASITPSERSGIYSHIDAMKRGNFLAVHTKQLKGDIRELIVGRHRVSYFKIGSTLYFVRGFAKKSAKTPKKEIAYAERSYKSIIQIYEK